MMSQGTEYTVTYKNMLGVDLSSGSDASSKKRYAYSENMYRDYENGGAGMIESVPGFRKIASLGAKIHGIYSHRNENGENCAVIHAGNALFRFKLSDRDALGAIEPIATPLNDAKSSAFRFGENLYVMDGSKIIKISASGEAVIIDSEKDDVYVPTTFCNGERIEQKNLLTTRFKEKYMIGARETVIYGSPELLYKITDESLGLCAVAGISDTFRGIINVPSYATIGTKRYKVDEIADNAFSNNLSILGIRLGVGIYRIGKFAFSGCDMLSSIYAYNAPRVIDDGAFQNCNVLSSFVLGAEIEKFGIGVFEGCSALKNIRYASDEKNFEKIENSSSLSDMTIYSFQKDTSLTLEIPLYTPIKEMISVTLDGKEITNYSVVNRTETQKSIVFNVSDSYAAEGKEVVIYARFSRTLRESDNPSSDFATDYGYSGSDFDAIVGCTVCESFDNRVFLSGNPSLPGVVFYSSGEDGKSSPLYFGVYDYFCDGSGVFGVTSMLSSADSLLVFKNADDGCGSIFYHTPRETSISFMPKIYPVTTTHNGIGALGASFSFFDDPVFVSKAGISAIDKQNLSSERSIACRSHNVNAELLSEESSAISLSEWCGYLTVGVNGKIYLADSRAAFLHPSGYREYEWFVMKEIGTWLNDSKVYRYASVAHENFFVHDEPESITDLSVYSVTVQKEKVYFVKSDDKRYEVYPTDEKRGGSFSPLVTLAVFEADILMFGTQNGDLCVFNNDKRGVAPEYIANKEDFDEDEYRNFYARRIHPYYYTFADHRMRCGIRTAAYDCSRPDLAKNTVKHSLTLKCRLNGNGRIRCEAKTNRSGYTEYSAFPNAVPDFSDWSFASLTLDSEETVSLPINEKEKNWIDKEISVYCDDFRSPIGIYSISYRYVPRGRIKHS